MALTLNFKARRASAFFSVVEWIAKRFSTFSGTKGMLTQRAMLWETLNKFHFQYFLYFQTYQTTYSNAFDICLKQSWMRITCQTNVKPLKPVRTQLFTTSNFYAQGALFLLYRSLSSLFSEPIPRVVQRAARRPSGKHAGESFCHLAQKGPLNR